MPAKDDEAARLLAAKLDCDKTKMVTASTIFRLHQQRLDAMSCPCEPAVGRAAATGIIPVSTTPSNCCSRPQNGSAPSRPKQLEPPKTRFSLGYNYATWQKRVHRLNNEHWTLNPGPRTPTLKPVTGAGV